MSITDKMEEAYEREVSRTAMQPKALYLGKQEWGALRGAAEYILFHGMKIYRVDAKSHIGFGYE